MATWSPSPFRPPRAARTSAGIGLAREALRERLARRRLVEPRGGHDVEAARDVAGPAREEQAPRGAGELHGGARAGRPARGRGRPRRPPRGACRSTRWRSSACQRRSAAWSRSRRSARLALAAELVRGSGRARARARWSRARATSRSSRRGLARFRCAPARARATASSARRLARRQPDSAAAHAPTRRISGLRSHARARRRRPPRPGRDDVRRRSRRRRRRRRSSPPGSRVQERPAAWGGEPRPRRGGPATAGRILSRGGDRTSPACTEIRPNGTLRGSERADFPPSGRAVRRPSAERSASLASLEQPTREQR